MTKRKRLRLAVIAVAVLLLGLIFIDSLDLFNPAEYRAVPHGSHNHYVPHDRNPDVRLDAFPTRPPGPGERITPDGQIVRE